jgi:hypothetical protein
MWLTAMCSVCEGTWLARRYDDVGFIYDDGINTEYQRALSVRENEEAKRGKIRMPLITNTSNDNTTKEEDNEVGYNSRAVSNADAQVRKEIEERETAKLVAEKIALLDGYGEDTFPRGTVLRYTKHFSEGDRGYTYAAIKFSDDDSWANTDGERKSWSQLVEWLVQGPCPVASIEVLGAPTQYPATPAAATTDVPKTDKA